MLQRLGFTAQRLPLLERPVPCVLEVLERRRVPLAGVEGQSLLLDPVLSLQARWQELPQAARAVPWRAGFEATRVRSANLLGGHRAPVSHRLLGGVTMGGDARDAFLEALLTAIESAARLGPGFTVRVGHSGIFQALIARRGFDHRMARVLEENLPALREPAERKALLTNLQSERGHEGTERFYEDYRTLVARANEAQVLGVFQGLLASMDLESYEADTDLQALIGRLLEKTRWQRDCREVGAFISLLESEAAAPCAVSDSAAMRELLQAEAEPAGVELFDALCAALGEAQELLDVEGVALELTLLPGNRGGYYQGPMFEILDAEGHELGNGGRVLWLLAEDARPAGAAGPTSESPLCHAFALSLDRLEAAQSAEGVTQVPGPMGEAVTWPRLLVAAVGEAVAPEARRAWWSLFWNLPAGDVCFDLAHRPLKRLFKAAAAQGFTHVVMVGEEEARTGTLTVKRLDDGHQATFSGAGPELQAFLFPDWADAERLWMEQAPDAARREDEREAALAAEEAASEAPTPKSAAAKKPAKRRREAEEESAS